MTEPHYQHLGGSPVTWGTLEVALLKFEVRHCLIRIKGTDGKSFAQRGYVRDVKDEVLIYTHALQNENDIADPDVIQALCKALRISRKLLAKVTG